MKYLILLISVCFSTALYADSDNKVYWDPVSRSVYSSLQNNDGQQRCRDIEGEDSPICKRLEELPNADDTTLEINTTGEDYNQEHSVGA